MATSLSTITQTTALYRSADLAAARRGSSVTANPLNAASQRVVQQLGSTVVQLSSFSQIKSGFDSLQTAAKDLSDPKKTTTSADIVKVAQSFTSAFNTTSKAVNLAISGDGKKSGALSGDGRATLVSNDLKSIVSSSNNVSDLKKIGISKKADGTLSVDTTALQNAFQANPNSVKDTLSRIGKQAEQVATRELAATGSVGGSINRLTDLSKNLESQSAGLKSLGSVFQDTGQGSANSLVSGAIKTYLQIFAF